MTPCSFFTRFTLYVVAQSLIEGSSWRSGRLFFTTRKWRIFLWNALSSLRRSRCYFIWRSNWSRSLNTLFHPSESMFFLTKVTYKWWEVEVLTFQRLIVGGRIGGIKGMSSGVRLRRPFPLPSLPQIFFSVSLLCQFFHTVEPGPGLRAKDSGFLKQKKFAESGFPYIYMGIWPSVLRNLIFFKYRC